MTTAARNLTCIADRFPALAEQLRAYRTAADSMPTSASKTEGGGAAPPRYRWQSTRNGGVAIQYRNTQSQWIWLNSSINPQREATRIAERTGDAAARKTAAGGTIPTAAPSLIIAAPLGNGYLIEELLARFKTADIAIVVSDIELCACALEARDLRPLLQNPRLALYSLTSPYTDTAAELIDRLYLPALHGSAILLWNEPLATHIAAQREARDALQQAIQNAKSNLAIYRQLGRVWMRNMLINGTTMNSDIGATSASAPAPPATIRTAPLSASAPTPSDERHTVSIVAAGPSLDRQLAQLKRNGICQQGDTHALISTDSALPALHQHNIAVDACVTLDCQLASYLHFRDRATTDTPLYADFAAHPLLYRMQRQVIATESAHPLSQLLSAALQLHPLLSRAEHVTQSAFALAISRYTPQQIILYGADYSYLSGKAYARGTYIPLHQLNRSNLTHPLELQSLLFSWRYNRQPTTTVTTERITPHFFRTYRTQLLRYATEHGYALIDESETDGMIFQKQRATNASPATPSVSTNSRSAWLATLTRYRTHIDTLSTPTPPYRTYLERLSNDEVLTLLSLLPLMAHIEQNPWRMHSETPFETARQETRKQIAHCTTLIERQGQGQGQAI